MNNKLISRIKDLIPNGSFLRDASLLAGGTGFAQLVTIFSMPVISRLYSPSDFGITAFIVAMIGILGSFSNAGYHLAVPLPQKSEKVRDLVLLSFFSQISLFILLVVIFTTLYMGLCDTKEIFQNPLIYKFLWLIPIGFLGKGFFELFHYRALKRGNFNLLSKVKIIQKFYGLSTMLILGLLKFKPSGLIIGQIVAQIGGVFTLARGVNIKKDWNTTSVNNLINVAKRYSSFPKYQIWAVFANNLYLSIVPVALINIWGAQVTGWYSFTMRILHLPANLVGQAISQVYLQRGSAIKSKEHLQNLTLKVFKALLAISTFPLMTLMIIAPDLFRIVFGKEWIMAGLYCRIFVPLVWINFCTSPISTIFVIKEKQARFLILQIIMLGLTVILLYIGTFYENRFVPLLIYGYGAFVVRHIYLITEIKTAGCKIYMFYLEFVTQITKSFVMVIPVLLLEIFKIALWIRVSAILILIMPWILMNRNAFNYKTK